MKTMRKLACLLLALTMLLALSATAFAADTGSITISNAAMGQTYSIYKLFDATVDDAGHISYTVPAGKTLGTDNTWFQVDTAGNVTAKENADITTEDFATWAKGFGVQVGNTVTATSNTVTFADVPYGYYYVVSSLGGTLTVDSTNPNATVIDKNETGPYVPEGGKLKTVDKTTAAIGDTVKYTVSFVATNFDTVKADGATEPTTTAITEYKITDVSQALDINNSTSVVVKVGETTISDFAVTHSDDATTGKHTMVITIPWQTGSDEAGWTPKYASPSTVTVTYSAVVNENATDKAVNQATVTYNNKSIPGDEVTTETYYFDLVKTDNAGVVLTGAKFKLYDAAANGNEVAVVKMDDGGYRVATADETGVEIEAGNVRISGLDGAKTYYLEETLAPAGYNMLTSRTAVAINSTDNQATVTTDVGTNVSTYVSGGVQVINNAGAELPSTGGTGTTILYILGTLMVLGAGVLLVVRRRVNAE